MNAYTTSGYLYSGVILSVAEWVHNDWITTQPKKVQYKHLWQELLLLQELRNVVWYWVKEKTMSEDYDLAQKAVLGLLANRE